MFIKIIFVFFLLAVGHIHAKSVVTTLPEFSWVVKELVGDKAKTKSLLSGKEDPHFVDASPAFIFKVAQADLVIMNGMELEIGWLPKVLEMSGNRKVQVGSTGLCDASKEVKKIEVLSKYDRSMGDVHPAGNPHYTLSIPRMLEAAKGIKNCLEKIGFQKKLLNNSYKKLELKMLEKYKALQGKVKAKRFYVYHREFNYLKDDFSFKFLQSLEEVPGVLPSATHLSRIALKAKKEKPTKVLAGLTSPTKVLEKFKELSGVNYSQLDLHPSEGEDFLEFMSKTFKKLNQD